MRFSRLHRGLFEDLPSSLDYGEVYICSDTTQVFMGLEDKSVEEIRDKKVLQEIANIKEDIEAKDTFLKNEIATTNETVEANKQEANKKIADLTKIVNDNQGSSTESLSQLEAKVDRNKTTTDKAIADLDTKVNNNKSATDTTIANLTKKVNDNKSDADTKYNSNLEKINANKTDADSKYNSNLQKINANKQDADSKYNANLEKINANKTYGENTYIKRAEYLQGNQDFNNLITPGAYFLVGAVHTNKPSSLQSGKGGFLQVSKFVSQGNTTVIQVFTDEVSGVTYSRVKTYSDNNTSWTEWNTHYSMNSKPTPGDINSYTKQEIDNKDTATLNSAKAYTYSKAEIDSKDTTTLNSAKSYADTKKNEAVTFATTELAKKLNLTGGALTGTLSFDRDDLGVVFYQNAKVYKKSGSGLTLAPHNDDLGVSIEDTQGNLIMRIAKNSPLIYRGNAVYHAGNKPTPSDIGASPSDHNHNSSYLPLINGSDNQSYVLRKKYIQIGENDSKSMDVGVGPTDTYINNNTSGKYLALKDNGDLHYGGKKVLRDIQGTPLWQGYHHMSGNEKVIPSKKLSECNNGWVIVWSDWDDGSQGQDWNVVYSYIPKNSLWKNGNNHLFGMASSNTQWAIKALGVRDDYIQGDDVNKQGNAYDVVIRAVLEY